MVTEMVFLLGRMGNNQEALTLIIERLGDVSRVSHRTYLSVNRWLIWSFRLQAIEFAKEQRDDSLWERLLKHSETRPRKSTPASPLTYFSRRPSDQSHSVYPWSAGERRCGDRPHSPHPPHQERSRDPRAERGAHQNLARFPSADLVVGGVPDDPQRRQC